MNQSPDFLVSHFLNVVKMALTFACGVIEKTWTHQYGT